jgi:anti-sigma factor ChrR (cupin superfamily)
MGREPWGLCAEPGGIVYDRNSIAPYRDLRSHAMDAVTPKSDKTADQHSHIVRPANMEWQKTRFPGCEVKTLLFDAHSGLVTALMRFEPGAVLPDHEHVKIEQTYVLSR